MGYSIGDKKYPLTGNWGIKGCYAYPSGKSVFYGTIDGGEISSPSQAKSISKKGRIRPKGWGLTCGQSYKRPLSVDECAKLCDENSTCAAFEYGNGRGSYKKGKCLLQSTNFATTCKG
jgi:hypothetical protein